MKLFTKALLNKLPPTNTEFSNDSMVYVKLFTPDSSWTWYICGYDPADGMAFGYVEGLESEWGYISIPELEEARGPLGLKVERDRWFTPTKFKDLKLQRSK